MRFSVGNPGNQNFSAYKAYTTYVYNTNLQNAFGMGANVSGFGNPDLKWQKTMDYNLGLDLTVLNNRLKINSIISNAKAFLKVQEEFGNFDHYIWSFVDFKVIDHRYVDEKEIPASDALSTKISKDLKKRGFKFVGPVIIYSYLQAIGIYNDHLMNCEWR